MVALAPCLFCQRHAFVTDRACPHCGKAFEASRLGLALAAMALVGVTACNEPAAPVAVYGPAPEPSGARLEPTSAVNQIPTEAPSVAPSSGNPPAPSASGLPSAAPSTTTTAPQQVPTHGPPAPIYGPPPRNPDNRADPLRQKP